jgi:integrase
MAARAILHNPAAACRASGQANATADTHAAELDRDRRGARAPVAAMVLVGAYGSLRWSELVALKRDDLDLEARLLDRRREGRRGGGEFKWGRPKTAQSSRTVDLPELVVRPLAEHLLRFRLYSPASSLSSRGSSSTGRVEASFGATYSARRGSTRAQQLALRASVSNGCGHWAASPMPRPRT